jgi:hypothetical protein
MLHMQTHTTTSYKCNLCESTSKREESIRKHVQKQHAEAFAEHVDDWKQSLVSVVDDADLPQRDVKIKLAAELRETICDVCDKDYKAPYKLAIHK